MNVWLRFSVVTFSDVVGSFVVVVQCRVKKDDTLHRPCGCCFYLQYGLMLFLHRMKVSTEAVRSFHRCSLVYFSIVIIIVLVVRINAFSNKNRVLGLLLRLQIIFRNQSFSPHSATSSPSQHKTINCSAAVRPQRRSLHRFDRWLFFYIAFVCGLSVPRLTNIFAFDRANTLSSILLIVHLTLSSSLLASQFLWVLINRCINHLPLRMDYVLASLFVHLS